ncbi:MAG TPA: hypothetical protein VH025_10045, partial [Solirubrobacteraceae bacterium]|nr:hypothetical protein [Solirubrobacteraceae bacterium]
MSDPGQAQAARLLGGKPPRVWLIAAGAVVAVAVALALVLVLKGGDSHTANADRGAGAGATKAATHSAAPAASSATGTHAAQTHAATAGGAKRANVSEVADPEEANSFPSPATVQHRAASTPSKAGEQVVAAG